jgi:hypothetical protein
MSDSRHISITVHYDRLPAYGRSLGWIAPQLKNAHLILTEDHADDERPTRTWEGLLDAPTFERFARDWRLEDELHEPNAAPPTDGPDVHTYTLDGLNWERGGESPIICVSVEVAQPAAA